MQVYLSGIHGLGKTTFVNNYSLEVPLVKIVNSDIVEPRDNDFDEQLNRIKQAKEIFSHTNKLKCNVLSDRSPLDFYIYNQFIKDGRENETAYLDHLTLELLEDWMETEPIVLLVKDNEITTWGRVLHRGRGVYKEQDREHFSKCYNAFYKHFTKLTGYVPVEVNLKDLEDVLNHLFSNS